MLTDDLITLFEDEGLGTGGTDLFAGNMPATPDTCTVFTESGGVAPRHAFGQGLPVIEVPRVQIRARGGREDARAARLRLERAYQLLVSRGPETISGGARYMRWEPIQMPFALGQDDNGRYVYAVNFEVWKEVSAL